MAEEHEIENEIENELEEFSVWKRNTPILYDLLISHPLLWPSLIVQWIPASPQPYSHPSFNTHKLLIAIHTSNKISNYLMVTDSTLSPFLTRTTTTTHLQLLDSQKIPYKQPFL
ncbi:unnamed protein product [Lathyrus sativus]|nr:unnamed protein product [Lathyrus sativus]